MRFHYSSVVHLPSAEIEFDQFSHSIGAGPTPVRSISALFMYHHGSINHVDHKFTLAIHTEPTSSSWTKLDHLNLHTPTTFITMAPTLADDVANIKKRSMTSTRHFARGRRIPRRFTNSCRRISSS